MNEYKRVFVVVLDSLGIGAMPDSPGFGDNGVDTFGHILECTRTLDIPNLRKLGLLNLHPAGDMTGVERPLGRYMRMAEASNAKDTMGGHWEMMGIGLCFVNLVDFDALWGHRRNVEGYGREIEKFDRNLGVLMEELGEDDLLILTADHGNDPTYTGTDHTREYVPFVAWSGRMERGGPLDETDTFAVIGATIAENFGVAMPEGTIGSSLLEQLV